MSECTDEALVELACAGDREAFSALVERHYDRIYRVGARVLNDAAAAEDLAQEVCIGLVGKLASFRGSSRFSTWLYRVVVNAALDAMRRRRHPAAQRAGLCREQRHGACRSGGAGGGIGMAVADPAPPCRRTCG